MNGRKNIFKAIAVVVCLVLLGWVNVGISAAGTENFPIVTNGNELLQAIERSYHGDTIGIAGEIAFYDGVTVGSENKQITLLRMNENAYLSFSGSEESIIQNITFDGNDIESMYPVFYSVSNVTLKNIIFQNCICNQGEGGAVALYGEGNTIFNNCVFRNNMAIRGGHVVMNGSLYATFENCLFENGKASNEGGAIWTNSVYSINNSVITQNEAGTYGGGIYNAGRGVLSMTKLYHNTAGNVGDDYATENGTLDFAESIAELVAIYESDEMKPIEWRITSDSGINGATLVLEYLGEQPETPEETEPTEPEPTEPEGQEPTEPEQPTESEEPEETQPDQPTGEEPGTEPETPDEENPDNEEPTTPAPPSEPSVNNNNTTTTTTTNSNSLTDNSDRSTHSTTTDNSRRTETNDSNNTSTVNNYYAQEGQSSSSSGSVQTIVVPAGNAGSSEPLQQTIRLEAPDGAETGTSGEMTLNVNVNVGADGAADQEAVSPVQQDGVSWYEAAVLCLLSAILVCQIKKR